MINRVSQFVARAVFRRWPEWREFENTSEVGDKKHFSILVPPINPNVDRGLWFLHNSGYEIIVYFDEDHCHIQRIKGETPIEWVQRAMDFTDTILHDKIVSVSWWTGEHCSMTSSRKPHDAKPNTRFARGGKWTKWKARSWSGKYDQDFTRV